jgi:glycosyltransferase involved in cell wall biosynthesis
MRELIAAFRQLSSGDPNLRLALVGDGVMREELVSLIRSTGLASQVMVPGGLPPEQVAQWIAAADVLTLPSWSEGYPNVVVEAIACGRPVVATDVGGTREIVNDSNGILVAPRSEVALADALSNALNYPWDEAAIAATIRRTWDDVAVDTLAVCETVVASRADQAR